MTEFSFESMEKYIADDWWFDEGYDWNATEVSTIIRQWAHPGNWLDLGCGPMLSVWPMFCVPEPKIWGCDKHPGMPQFHELLKNRPSNEWPHGLLRAVQFYNRTHGKANNLMRERTAIDSIQNIYTESVLKDQLNWHGSFDTVVQIGCFGCLKSITELKAAISLVKCYLRPGGRFISVTWLPRQGYEEDDVWGGDILTTLSAHDFEIFVRASLLSIIAVRVAEVQDPNHYRRYVIVAEKPSFENITDS